MLAKSEQFFADSSDILQEARIAYMILYVHDLAQSRFFYEEQLGLQVIEADDASVKYDAGMVMLLLNRASDYGINLAGRQNGSSIVVFLVDDIDAVCQNLSKRGIVFERRHIDEDGLYSDFYDPNGHHFTVYQPSQEAMSWASGEKIRQLWRSCGKDGAPLIRAPGASLLKNGQRNASSGLNGKPLIYLDMFVPSSDEALAYYKASLGLKEVERVHCRNLACPPEEMGVSKYDVGGVLLGTYHIHASYFADDSRQLYSPQAVDPAHTLGVVPVFLVTGIEELIYRLSRKGVNFTGGLVQSQIGGIAKFQSTTGHTFYLYEPSNDALKWPSGEKINQILAAQV